MAQRQTDEFRCLIKFTKKESVSPNQAESFTWKGY